MNASRVVNFSIANILFDMGAIIKPINAQNTNYRTKSGETNDLTNENSLHESKQMKQFGNPCTQKQLVGA